MLNTNKLLIAFSDRTCVWSLYESYFLIQFLDRVVWRQKMAMQGNFYSISKNGALRNNEADCLAERSKARPFVPGIVPRPTPPGPGGSELPKCAYIEA